MKRVVVGLSGGVDSSVAAFLLKEQGYEVIALFMKNWHDDTVTISNECPWLEDSHDAMIVAQKLGIPFQTVDLSQEYKTRIVDYMFEEYQRGRTPNPDVLCNREIKFDIFLKLALELKADFIATGHYCQVTQSQTNDTVIYHLLSGEDPLKDQSYFLCQLSQSQLSKTLFPIGHLTKPEVRSIAQKQGLITANKKDSQGLCFIGKVKLPVFLQQQLAPKEGYIVEIPNTLSVYHNEIPNFSSDEERYRYLAAKISYQLTDGKVVGKHQGAHYFTKGQRKGLHVGGTAEALFVIDTDVDKNIIYTGQGQQHPGLYRKALFVNNDDVHWVREDLSLELYQEMKVHARIRYRQPLQQALLYRSKLGMYVVFDELQSAITEGQFVVWYRDNELLGSGIIS